jgi:HlyD family secretion protein
VAIGKDRTVVGALRTLFSAGTTAELSDGQFLERFATGRGEVAERAFATLVERHGPMVHRVCRGVLADAHDTQDAFQATFLVLVAKARKLWVRDSLGSWLHQVAYRTASCARVGAARRRRLERRAAVSVETTHAGIGEDRELGLALHEKIERLPERFRAPLVLCDVQGLTHEQTARHLGWPVGTVKSRLSRARERLRDRLRRRGVAPGAALLATTPGLDASVPPALFDATVAAASGTRAAHAVVRGSAAALAREVLQNMIMLRIIQVGALALVAGATATGIGLLAQEKGGAEGSGAVAKIQAARADNVPDAPAEVGPLRITVTERGNLESSRNVDVINEVEGQTTILSILPEGTRVKKGDLVCELDSATLRDLLVNQEIRTQRARADYENAIKTREVAEITVEEYTEGYLKQEREALEDERSAAERSIVAAAKRIERIERARKRVAEVLAQKDTVTAADIVAELDIEERLVDAHEAEPRARMAIKHVRQKMEALEITRRKHIAELGAAVDRAKADELAKEAAYKLEQVKLEKLRRQLDKCKLYAPTDGFVLYANDPARAGQPFIEEGAAVRERQLLFRLPDLTHMRVNAKVHEAMVDRLQPGMKAQVRVDAFPDRTLTGTVKTVAPLPDPVSFGRAGVKVYSTLVELDEPFAALRPGMTAEVAILVEQRDGVLTVPLEAVLPRRVGGTQVAVKQADGGFLWREVKLGATDDRRVEVKAGLESGERVALNPLALLDESERREILDATSRPADARGVPSKKGSR